MASPDSPLARVLKKSLDIQYSKMSSEVFGWNEAAQALRQKYDELIKLHDAIDEKVRAEWTELAKRYETLRGKMLELEKAKIGTEDKERQAYTKKVKDLITEATTLQDDIKAEPDRRAAQAEYLQYAPQVVLLMKYLIDNGLQKVPEFNNLKQAKDWMDNPPPSPNQMARIVAFVKAAQGVKKAEEERQIKAAKDAKDLKEQQDQAEQIRQKKVADDAQRLQAQQQKAAERERERKARAAEVNAVLNDSILSVQNETARYGTINTQIGVMEGKLTGSKLSVSKDKLDALKKNIENQTRPSLLNKGFQILDPKGAGFADLSGALAKAQSKLDGFSVDELETLDRDLVKVLDRMDDLIQLRESGDYSSVVAALDPTPAPPTPAPPVFAYVFSGTMAAAKSDMKHIVGALAGVVVGRSSPHGKATHIHVGGNAQYNAIFDRLGPSGEVRLLGFVNGHMEKGAPPPVRNEEAEVERRASGTFTRVQVDYAARSFTEV